MANKLLENSYGNGVNTDLAEDRVANSMLTSAHNIKLTTDSDKQLVLQKVDGLKEVVDGYPSNLTPLVSASYNDVTYFVSVDESNNEVEYGMFPSIDPDVELLSEVPGSSTNLPVVTDLGSVSVTMTALNNFTIPASPDEFETITVTNTHVAGPTGRTLTMRLGTIQKLRDHSTSASVYGDLFTLTPGQSKVFKVSGSDSCPQGTNTPGGFTIQSTSSQIQLIVESVVITSTGAPIEMKRFVPIQAQLINQYNKDNPLYIAAKWYNYQGGQGDTSLSPQLSLRSGPTMKSFWLEASPGNVPIKMFLYDKNRIVLGILSFSSAELIGTQPITGTVNNKTVTFTYSYLGGINRILVNYASSDIRCITITDSSQSEGIPSLSLPDLSADANYSTINASDPIRQFYKVTFGATPYGFTNLRSVDFNIANWGSVTSAKILATSPVKNYEAQPISSGSTFRLYNSGADTITSMYVTIAKNAASVLVPAAVAMYDYNNTFAIQNKYNPIRNFFNGTVGDTIPSSEYTDPFRTTVFGYTKDSDVELELQPSYDGSVNMITACRGTVPRIVNTRTKIDVAANTASLIVRDGGNLENVYSTDTIDKTRLIPYTGNIQPVLTFNGVLPDKGSLPCGGYYYYFRLTTADGAESEIIEQSRLVSVHFGAEFGDAYTRLDDVNTTNAVSFTLSNLTNKSFRYCSVYFTRAVGETDTPVRTAYRIESRFDIIDNECSIVHTGSEAISVIDPALLMVEYTPISSTQNITQKNGRLLLGDNIITSVYNEDLRTAALYCYVDSTSAEHPSVLQSSEWRTVDDRTYANPYNVYYHLGYHPGETYELAINFVFDSGVVSPAYPIQGRDFTVAGAYDFNALGKDIKSTITGQNSLGLVRTKREDFATNEYSWYLGLKTYTMTITTASMLAKYGTLLSQLGVISFFISRRKRKPDMLMNGLMTFATAIPKNTSTLRTSAHYTLGNWCGIGIDSKHVGSDYVMIPAPGGAINYSSEKLYNGTAPYDAIVYAPIPEVTKHPYFAIYSPDLMMSTAKELARFSDGSRLHGIQLTSRIGASIEADSSSAILVYQNSSYIEQTPRAAYGFVDQIISPVSIVTPSLQMVSDSQKAFSSKSFSGRADRQLYFYLNYPASANLAINGGRSPITLDYIGSGVADSEDKSHSRFIELASQFINTAYPNYKNQFSYINGDFAQADLIDDAATVEDQFVACRILANNVAFSPYLGVEIPGGIGSLASDINLTPSVTSNLLNNRTLFSNIFQSNTTFKNQYNLPSSPKLGYLVSIYSSANGQPVAAGDDWFNRYPESSSDPYVAISERIPLSNNSAVKLTGGDAYVGYYYQQVWRSPGIDGIPTASDPSAYIKSGDIYTREGTGLSNSGYVIAFPTRSNYNFALRAAYVEDDVEKKLYGGDRTYISAYNVKSVKGSRQPESQRSNLGNMSDSMIVKSKYDSTIPYNEVSQPNRIYVSDAHVPSSFTNGYRNLKGFNFRDYDQELGSISAMVSAGLYTYIVYRSGVSAIEVLERAAVSGQNGTNIYISNADVLPTKSINILSFIGSRFSKSVIASEFGIFGVDTDRKKIWKVINASAEIISEGRVQYVLNQLCNNDLENVVTTYDQLTGEVYFTFIRTGLESVTMVFNSKLNAWYGTSDDTWTHKFMVSNDKYAVKKVDDVYRLYELNPDLKCVTESWDGAKYVKDIKESYFEFVLRDESNTKMSLENIILNGDGIPSRIEVIPSATESFIVDKLFGTNDLPCHTNIFTKVSKGGLSIIDSYTIKINTDKELYVGDLITLNLQETFVGTRSVQAVVAAIVFEGGRYTITLANSIGSITNLNLIDVYYGWKVPLRLSLIERDNSITKVSIPSKKQADLMAGRSIDSERAVKELHNARPSGRWCKLRLYFNGMDPIYINSIISSINFLQS